MKYSSGIGITLRVLVSEFFKQYSPTSTNMLLSKSHMVDVSANETTRSDVIFSGGMCNQKTCRSVREAKHAYFILPN